VKAATKEKAAMGRYCASVHKHLMEINWITRHQECLWLAWNDWEVHQWVMCLCMSPCESLEGMSTGLPPPVDAIPMGDAM
jgi:hypothetical protein